MSNSSNAALALSEYRTRLTIASDDITVIFRIKRDGSGNGKIVVIPFSREKGNGVEFLATDRQQRYYANEINALLLAEEGSKEASCDGIVAWLGNQLERA